MSDDAFYRPNRPPPAPRQPTPGEPLWSLRHDHITWSGELRFHGESYGWEAQILRDGDLVIGQRFVCPPHSSLIVGTAFVGERGLPATIGSSHTKAGSRSRSRQGDEREKKGEGGPFSIDWRVQSNRKVRNAYLTTVNY